MKINEAFPCLPPVRQVCGFESLWQKFFFRSVKGFKISLMPFSKKTSDQIISGRNFTTGIQTTISSKPQAVRHTGNASGS